MCEGPISYLYLVIIGTTLVLPRKYIAFGYKKQGPQAIHHNIGIEEARQQEIQTAKNTAAYEREGTNLAT